MAIAHLLLKRRNDCQREMIAGAVLYERVHKRQFSTDVAEGDRRRQCATEKRDLFLLLF